jgi:hypothetical protein
MGGDVGALLSAPGWLFIGLPNEVQVIGLVLLWIHSSVAEILHQNTLSAVSWFAWHTVETILTAVLLFAKDEMRSRESLQLQYTKSFRLSGGSSICPRSICDLNCTWLYLEFLWFSNNSRFRGLKTLIFFWNIISHNMQVLAGSLHHVASSISDSAKFGCVNSSSLVPIF